MQLKTYHTSYKCKQILLYWAIIQTRYLLNPTVQWNTVLTLKDSSIGGVIWGHREGYKGDSSSMGAH